MSIEVPLQQDLADELIEFWADIYGTPLDVPREMLLGDETDHNLHTLYLARRGHKLAGTCLLTVSKAVPMLGGLGEVATASASRRTGIATELCSQAVEDFRARGGQAFFLGTVNADAARVYHRLGWRKLPGAGVMLNVTGRKSPEEFLVDYFRDIGETNGPRGFPCGARPHNSAGPHASRLAGPGCQRACILQALQRSGRLHEPLPQV